MIKLKELLSEKMDKRQGGETLKQLGGNRFIAMTGAKNFAVGPKGMSFKIGRNSKNVNYVRIDLKGDLYNMEFIQMRAGKMKVKSKEKGVYNDQLQKMFTKNTGMYTSLQENMMIKLKDMINENREIDKVYGDFEVLLKDF